jgi:DNA-binding HxlR family transcriptional regulator/putative sterol carrier protein
MKSYAQFCPLATALDVIGDRWTLLLVRELLFLGPRRFTDLAAGLPGIAPNLLSTRLKSLEAAGVVERIQLPPPAGSTVYRLTDDGEDLREPILALARWGMARLGPPPPGESLRPELPVIVMRAVFDAEAARGVTETYELVLDDTRLSLHVHDGSLDIEPSGSDAADLRITMSRATFAAIVADPLDTARAVAAGEIALDGDAAAVDRFVRIFASAFQPAPEPAEA